MTNDISEEENPTPPSRKRVNVVLLEPHHHRIDQQIEQFEKKTGVRISKGQWIKKAIASKFKSLKKSDAPKNEKTPSKGKPVGIRIDHEIFDQIKAHVDLERKQSTYSINQWILTAIEEQLKEELEL